MREFGIRPNRDLGQNFLIDSNILDVIARAAELDADDVVYTIKYLIDPAVKLRYKSNWAWIQSVEKLSQYKVRITSKSPVPAMAKLTGT